MPADLPIVSVAPSQDRDVLGVAIDAGAGIRAAVEHLVSLGHRRILHLGRMWKSRPGPPERIAAFRAAMASAGLETLEHMLDVDIGYHQDLSDQIEAYRRCLEDGFVLPAGITAVLCHNDNLALGLYAYLARRGIRVPADLSVIGFDNGSSASALPAMTTIDHMLPEMGSRAVDLLLQRIGHTAGAGPAPASLVIPARLVLRQSTGACR